MIPDIFYEHNIPALTPNYSRSMEMEKKMSDEKEESKILKLAAKKKTKAIIKMLEKADSDVIKDALNVMAGIGDEDSINCITSYLDSSDNGVKVAAAKAAMAINSEYLRTQVLNICNKESDPEVKKELFAAFHKE